MPKMIWLLFIICTARIVFFKLNGWNLEFSALHELCIGYVSWRDLPPIYNGLICGSKNIDNATEILFRSTGLYHLIVVSGSHLVLLDTYLEYSLLKNFYLKWFILFLFCGLCDFQAPIVRALCSYTLIFVSNKLYLGFRNDQHILASGLITLIVCPHMLDSISLQLSWMAALCVSLPISNAKKSFLILAYLYPFFGWQNPLWSINNIIFMALFESCIFPISVWTTLLPGTTFAAHAIWDLTLRAVSLMPSSPPEHFIPQISLGWLAVFFSQLLHKALAQ